MPYYTESRVLVNGLGYELLDLKIIRSGGNTRVNVVISGFTPAQGIGTEDCAKVHRALQLRLEALTGIDDFAMEVASPGMERTIKNAAELALFAGRAARFWDTRTSSWTSGIIIEATSKDVTIAAVKGESAVTQDADESTRLTIPLLYIAKAKLVLVEHEVQS
jgi:ribosome maturation factor RimP